MKKISKEIKVFLLLGLFLAAVAAVFQIPAYEGINPSDDGVILAQSYRMLQGQIPHDDFISIRPVGSALFHSIALLLPGSFEVNARWIVYLQYLIYSFIWAWLFFQCLPKKHHRISLLVFLSVVIFVCNQNHYNLFPWTTIDALFFFSLGYLFFRQSRFVPALLFAALASLCRQTFALPFLVMLVAVIRTLSVLKDGKRLVKTLLLASIPFVVYMAFLLRHHLFGDFIRQMTGRTEIWQTGFVKFWTVFWDSPLAYVFFVLLLMYLYDRLRPIEESSLIRSPVFVRVLLIVSGLTVLSLTGLIFFDPARLFLYSFQFFFLVVILVSFRIYSPVRDQINEADQNLIYWVLLIAWTASVSLGDNSPVFATGLLAGGVLLILLQGDLLPVRPAILYISSLLLVSIFVYGQRNNNYRDLPATDLNFKAGEIFSGLGSIRTNERTASYLSEVKRIYEQLHQPNGRLVLIPNGAIFYPLLESLSPMPIDWMQGAEFVGQEAEVIDRIIKAADSKPLYFLIDRFDSKRMSDSLVPSSYPAVDYPYFNLLMDSTRAIDSIQSEWFDVRQWK